MRTAFAALLMLALTSPLAAGPQPFAAELADGMGPEQQRAEAEKHLRTDPPDLVEARLWLEHAATNGSAEAMGAAGWLYEQGLGVERDIDRALEYYTLAYDAGDSEYGIRIGWMYIQGFGLEPDRAMGERWFRRVIDERDDSQARLALASTLIADAMANLQPDPAPEAIRLLERALEDGLQVAAYYLARIHIDGLGSVPANPARAAHFTRIGAESGHPQMQGWMAILHARGELVPLDLVEAHKWASLAAAGGDPVGEQLRREIEERLDRQQSIEARRRALEWLNRQ